jgi:hypothetical protein
MRARRKDEEKMGIFSSPFFLLYSKSQTAKLFGRQKAKKFKLERRRRR